MLLFFYPLCSFSQPGNSTFDAVEDDVLDLQLVFVVRVVLRQMSELLKTKTKIKFFSWSGFNLGQMQAVVCEFGGDKVLGNLDTVVNVADLKCKCRVRMLLRLQPRVRKMMGSRQM